MSLSLGRLTFLFYEIYKLLKTSQTIDGLTISPKYDMLNRNKGKEIFNGSNKVDSEQITYLKKGDHATMMPSTIRFGDCNGASYAVNESIKYAYDNMGNIIAIYENGILTTRYKYDALNRLIREDNKAFNKTYVFTYDNNGNILRKREYAFTLKEDVELTELLAVENKCVYDGDKLISYNEQDCEYDAMGCPTTYRGMPITFANGFMTNYNGINYKYDGFGRRTEINELYNPLYDSNGNIVDDGKFLYIYDNIGLVGFYEGTTKYLYRKDALGNIIAILDQYGVIIARYVYDAWGNHKILNASGQEIIDPNNIAVKNPFRYRSYYYDTDTGLYYLKARYYDPETGRFISPDSIEYINPENVNGLNLYAYCSNNPVMNIDPNGNMPLLVIALIAGVISAGANVLSQVVFDDKSFGEIEWGKTGISFASGFLSGLIPGSGFLSLIGQAAISSVVENGLLAIAYNEEFTFSEVMKDFGIQFATGMLLKQIGKVASKITNKLFIKAPNYSQYQHYFRSKGLNYTIHEVYEQMFRQVKRMHLTNRIINNTFDILLNFATGVV